ncbi:MAG: hypothetical protein LIP01_04025 [Tannerellaceae bacterium]|nr:hypothetical protein [Tannerellaceae bacterium]
MKSDKKITGTSTVILYLLLILFIGCKEDDPENKQQDNESVISLFITAASSQINEDTVHWEDRVDELRMIVTNPENGEVLFNQKLYFPNGFDQQSKAVVLPVGTHNFYFIANETVYTGDFVNALINIQNESEFESDTRFTNLAYNPEFIPDETSNQGRFVMSAIYRNITVSGGGAENNPTLLTLPTGRVELIRSLAKVEVIFRKKVSGSTIPDHTVTSVLLEQAASSLSVPPLDSYYTGSQLSSEPGSLTGFDYTRDSIGTIIFYIPELLIPVGNNNYTILEINNQSFPIESDTGKSGLASQRRTVPALSDNSVIRNYHYLINVYIDAEGGLQIRTYVEPWIKDTYSYLFQGDQQIVIPPIIPTDSSIIIPTECGKVEIISHNESLTQGLQGAYNDTVIYWDPEIQGPTIHKGNPPYYCEKKYGADWRLINSCELLSFLAVLDVTYNVWMSNTWLAQQHNLPYYSLHFRQEAQSLLEKLTGTDLFNTVLMAENNWEDEIPDEKLDIVDRYFTPGDIMVRVMDYPNGWPFESPPGTTPDEDWFYNEVTTQVKAFWYGSGYISPAIRANWDKILYDQFFRYDYSSTVSRCVRTVE